jgi:hypothetical protein
MLYIAVEIIGFIALINIHCYQSLVFLELLFKNTFRSISLMHIFMLQGLAKAVGLFFGSTLVFAYFGESFNV